MKKKILIFGLSIIFSSTQIFVVHADIQADIIEEVQQQQQIEGQLSQIEASINELEDHKKQIIGEIDRLDGQLITTLASINSLTDQINDKEVQLEQTAVALRKAEAVKQEQYDAMKKRIQYLYEKGGNIGWASILLQEKNITELLNQAEYTQKMYEYDRKCLESYAAVVDQVNDLQSQLKAEKSELDAMRSEQESQKIYMEQMLKEKRTTFADYDTQLADANAKAKVYQQLIKQQNMKIQQLVEEQKCQRQQAEEAKQQAEEAKQQAVQQNNQSNNHGGSNDDITDNNENDKGRFCPNTHTGSVTGQDVVNYALQFVGHPYIWGGDSLTNGTDCSGFVHLVYAHFGYNISRQSEALRSDGYGVSYAKAKPGDIVCYNGHVAIYMGSGAIVHASDERSGIKVSNNAAYRDILAVRRII